MYFIILITTYTQYGSLQAFIHTCGATQTTPAQGLPASQPSLVFSSFTSSAAGLRLLSSCLMGNHSRLYRRSSMQPEDKQS